MEVHPWTRRRLSSRSCSKPSRDWTNDDIRLFYAYFDDLKRHVRQYLGRKARAMPGETAVAQSALVSLFWDMAMQQIPLSDVDEHGYPMLWPLLLIYVERHCDKWKKYYQAGKRNRTVVSLAASETSSSDATRTALEPSDYREGEEAAERFAAVCEEFYARLTPEEQTICELRMQNKSLTEISQAINRSESTVSDRLQRIRKLLGGL